MKVDKLKLIQNSGFDTTLNATSELMIIITTCN